MKNYLLTTLICAAGFSSTLAASNLTDIGYFDGSTGLLSSCVELYSDSGDILVNAQGQQERYLIDFGIATGDDTPDQVIFDIRSAALSTQTNCSGRYQEGILTDSVLIENAGQPFSGKIYTLTMRLTDGPEVNFLLLTNAGDFGEVRDLASNSIAFGAELGSFQSDSTLTFNTVNLPLAYPLQAPQCSDADGDTAEVLVEISGQVVQRASPGREFLLDTSSIPSGSTEVRVRCSDISSLSSRVDASTYGKSTSPANGVLNLSVAQDPACLTSIEAYMQNLSATLPSWQQLECFTSVSIRQSAPNFYLLAGDTPPEEFSSEAPLPFFEFVQNGIQFDAAWPGTTVSSAIMSEAPPHLINGAAAYTEEEWDQKQRAMATYGTYLKQLGYRLQFNFFFPPSLFEPGSGRAPITQTSAEFLTWWQDVYIPERVTLAQTAERIKAEYYQPWDIEPGQFVRSMGDLWLDQLSEAEQINVTQQAIDLLFAAIRPEFTGTLILINYDRFAAFGDHWKLLNLSAWDQVHFAIFTEGDVEATEFYLQEQLAGYLEMVQRDGISNWGLAEITVDPAAHQRLLDQSGMGTQFADIESQIYQAVFNAVADLAVPLKSLALTTGNIVTTSAEALVREKLAILASMN